ncbi:hypothetical protein H6G54_05765 [Anabaena cylindrica FACHB-243]|uniref:Uncharacterized protein n=1 Tax=Anabaena cylindrica (strain ATCC 27899 / PCC 7122) TaxID=272123 RepID=K9ZKV7_ANACC|nr:MULTISPECIES: HEPN domain-containing protein [Anabaena]AFZ59826.1 hypothetical protein Anacy_4468 [Anabaena cylindrica PCC 7122]MBD2417225.1 hypothetical protein [Anabaena cylindrica FACHB-243]MBY5282309.1 hypothetical protein [Anabaena sp. CCAP 1446/1C]MBY5309765.1 hypothetical protein [Anabaena sp. CCAP 1446/1C]MCM2404959.1 HEPN domain-containing protein [Anabaena sp. CCAP 1446/1C]
MREEVVVNLKNAITQSLRAFNSSPIKFIESHFQSDKVVEWRRVPNGWQSFYVNRPNNYYLFSKHQKLLDDLGVEFTQIVRKNHREYENLVGFQSLNIAINILHNSSMIVKSILCELWDRYNTFNVNDEQINIIIQEFADFVDNPKVRFRYTAILLNFRMDKEQIFLTDDIIIRQLSEKEVSDIYKDSPSQYVPGVNRVSHIHEFVIEGEFEEVKRFDDSDLETTKNVAIENLNNAVLALNTFQGGSVGYECITFKTVKFSPIMPITRMYGGLHIPVGNYYLLECDVERFQNHAKLIFSKLDEPLERAFTKLADAELRIHSKDRLLDAVAGLEAILLASMGKETEIKFRFSLNYSTLFDNPENRLKEYQVAKHLYDIRSTIAHGGIPKDPCKIGEEKLSLNKAAQKACGILRYVIHYFLNQSKSSLYKDPKFWENGYFGIEPRF